MESIICDRCKRRYDWNERYTVPGYDHAVIGGIAVISPVWQHSEAYFLCDDCLEDFFERYMKKGRHAS